MSLTGFGARSLVPDELLEGYGEDAALPEGWLLRPGFPLAGRVTRRPGYPTPSTIVIYVGAVEFPEQRRRLLIWQAAYDAVIGGIGRAALDTLLENPPSPNPQFLFRWRILASGDPWTEVPGEFLGVSLHTFTDPLTIEGIDQSFVTEGTRIVRNVIIEDRRLTPAFPEYDPTAPDLPDTDDIIEFFVIGPIPPDEYHPVIVEGITAGQFAVNAYAGLYSARDEDGAVVPTGIRYDEDAFAQMTDLVRIRLDAPIDDLRNWLETNIYAPTGWVPALDSEGRISPVSQVAPTDTSSLTVVDNAVTEPSPDWDAGQRIINILRFTYPRDYIIGKPDTPPPVLQVVRQNLIGQRDIVLEFRDELSIARHGEQVLEISGEAFRAIGKVPETEEEEAAILSSSMPTARPRDTERRRRQATGTLNLPLNEAPIVRSGVVAVPISGDIEDETGWQLAQLRDLHVGNRYAYGAQAISLNVMRAAIPDHRAGDWVWLDLSWLPDYLTQRRGLAALVQIVAIGDPDCAWRHLLVEVVTPVGGS